MEKHYDVKILKPTKVGNLIRRRVRHGNSLPSKTKQAFKDECDINNIVKKLDQGIPLNDLIKQNPQYGDFSDVPTYQESLNRVIFANEQFAALPSAVRDRFHNEPSEFLEFASNPENLPELVKMGLAVERPVPGATLDDLNASLKALNSKPDTEGAIEGTAAAKAESGSPKKRDR